MHVAIDHDAAIAYALIKPDPHQSSVLNWAVALKYLVELPYESVYVLIAQYP
jgi:hypothetical protein